MVSPNIVMLSFFVIISQCIGQDKSSGLLERSQIEEKYKWDLSDLYSDLIKTYYGDAVTVTDYDAHAWTEWPHFYFGFYIYSYATSFAAAIQISERIRNEGEPAANRFMRFLESGSSDYPINVLEKAGVDLTSPESIETVVKKMNELMDDIENM